MLFSAAAWCTKRLSEFKSCNYFGKAWDDLFAAYTLHILLNLNQNYSFSHVIFDQMHGHQKIKF